MNIIIIIMSQLLEFIYFTLVFSTKHTFNFSKMCSKISMLLFCLIHIVINVILPATILQTIISALLLFVYLLIIFRDSFLRKLKTFVMSTLFINIIFLIVGILLSLYFSLPNYSSSSESLKVAIQEFVCFIILFVIITFLYIKYKYRFENLGNKSFRKCIAVIVAMNILLLIVLFRFYEIGSISKTSVETLISVLFSAVFIDVVVTLLLTNYLYDSMSKAHNTEIRARDSERMVEYFASMAEHNEDTRRFRHDMRHHLLNVKLIIEHGDNEEAVTYLDEYLDLLDTSDIIQLDNMLPVGAILTHVKNVCRELDYNFDPEVFVDHLPMTDKDASVMIGNMLDNALTAFKADDPKHRMLLFEIKPVDKYIMISCRNHFSGKLIHIGNTYRTTKLDPLGHGYGLTSIFEIAKRYHADPIIETDNNIFSISVYLKKGPKPEPHKKNENKEEQDHE